MSTKTHLALLLTGMAWEAGSAIGAEMSADQQALLKALPEAKITLQQGLAASASQGQPLSAKFEIDEGHFQLSVYTAKGSAFSEVIVDYTTGKIAKAEAITAGDEHASSRGGQGRARPCGVPGCQRHHEAQATPCSCPGHAREGATIQVHLGTLGVKSTLKGGLLIVAAFIKIGR